MTGWEADKKRADKFTRQIKCLIGATLISDAPVEEDQQRNTDLIVLTLKPYRIACRVRKAKYFEEYGGQFTIRTAREFNKTELAKILEGFGDFLFYGIANEEDAAFQCWGIGDLAVFRTWYSELLARGKRPGIHRTNKDGSSDFDAFWWAQLPPSFAVGQRGIPCFPTHQPLQARSGA